MAVRLQPATIAIHVLSESRVTRSAALAAEGVSRGSQACSPTQYDARQRTTGRTIGKTREERWSIGLTFLLVLADEKLIRATSAARPGCVRQNRKATGTWNDPL